MYECRLNIKQIYNIGAVAEWLRREIRNLLRSRAQVRVLSASLSFFPRDVECLPRLSNIPHSSERIGNFVLFREVKKKKKIFYVYNFVAKPRKIILF
jgi:hypothetical protein